MREIKFRWYGMINDEGPKMHNVLGIHWGAGVVELKDDYGSTYDIGDRLMQFTGLYDKNGKEIYEGDIIKKITGCSIMNGIEMQLFYIGEIHSFNPITGYKCGKLELWANSSIIYDCEIIGNKHENKELLNQGN